LNTEKQLKLERNVTFFYSMKMHWHDDPETLPLIKDRAVNDEHNNVRRAAVEALAEGWHDDPEIISLIKKIKN